MNCTKCIHIPELSQIDDTDNTLEYVCHISCNFVIHNGIHLEVFDNCEMYRDEKKF